VPARFQPKPATPEAANKSSICASVFSADPRASLPCALQPRLFDAPLPENVGVARAWRLKRRGRGTEVRVTIGNHVDGHGTARDPARIIFQALERLERHEDDGLWHLALAHTRTRDGRLAPVNPVCSPCPEVTRLPRSAGYFAFPARFARALLRRLSTSETMDGPDPLIEDAGSFWLLFFCLFSGGGIVFWGVFFFSALWYFLSVRRTCWLCWPGTHTGEIRDLRSRVERPAVFVVEHAVIEAGPRMNHGTQATRTPALVFQVPSAGPRPRGIRPPIMLLFFHGKSY